MQLHRQRCEVDAIARALVDELQAKNQDRVIALDVAAPVPPVDGDAVRIEQVLSNLLTLKYSTPTTRVGVEVRAEGTEVHVLVTNVGPGFSADEASKLFDRFYRAAQGRAGGTRGLTAPPVSATDGMSAAAVRAVGIEK